MTGSVTALGRVMAPALDATSLLVERNDTPSDFRILDPAEVATRLNKRFSWTQETGQFFTLVYGILDVETREFNFTSADIDTELRCNKINMSCDA